MTVVVERAFAEPVALESVQAIEDGGAWCLEAHGVRFLRTFFSRDRRRMLCVYDAPDAEAVRLAQRQAGVPFDRAWPARVIEGESPAGRRQLVVVERDLPQPFAEEDVRLAAGASQWCLEAHGCRRLESFLSGDGLRMVCVFEAPDAESVRLSQRQAEMPVSAVWPGTSHDATATEA
jgi:hypothetical protein